MLRSMLEAGRPLLADGATGANLFAMGLASGDSPQLWNDTHRRSVLALHRGFVAAGADIILTNSFGGNRRRLIARERAATALSKVRPVKRGRLGPLVKAEQFLIPRFDAAAVGKAASWTPRGGRL